jgi:hypothetical protein
MELKDIVAVLLSVLALIVSLGSFIFVIVQVQLFRSQLRVDAYARIVASNKDLVCLGFENDQLLRILSGEEIENAEFQKRYLQLWVNHAEMIWTAREHGMLDDSQWHAMKKDIGELFSLKTCQAHWKKVLHCYSPEFNQFVMELLPPHSLECREDTARQSPMT